MLADNKKRLKLLEIAKMRSDLSNLINDLANANFENDRLIEKINNTLYDLPQDTKEIFLEKWNEKPQEQKKSFEMEL